MKDLRVEDLLDDVNIDATRGRDPLLAVAPNEPHAAWSSDGIACG
jgi:hypothetical protein